MKELKAENERLRGLLREARTTFEMWKDVAPAISLCADIDAALSQQAEPAGAQTCKCEGLCEQRGLASDEVDATCRAIHGGPAGAQDERDSFKRYRLAGEFCVSRGIDDDSEIRPKILDAFCSGYACAGRPVQTKQQPVADVMQLVEALSALRGCIMETRGPDAHSALVLADAALAAQGLKP